MLNIKCASCHCNNHATLFHTIFFLSLSPVYCCHCFLSPITAATAAPCCCCWCVGSYANLAVACSEYSHSSRARVVLRAAGEGGVSTPMGRKYLPVMPARDGDVATYN